MNLLRLIALYLLLIIGINLLDIAMSEPDNQTLISVLGGACIAGFVFLMEWNK